MPKPKKSKKKNRLRVVVEVILGPGEHTTPMFEVGVWYVASAMGGFTTSGFSKEDTVMLSERGNEVQHLMESWQQDYPGRRWGFCVSEVESDKELGGLRRARKTQ